jgi:uncharacterized protein
MSGAPGAESAGMTSAVVSYATPAAALAVAGQWLARDPRRNNLLLTLLSARSCEPQPGRYWAVLEGAEVVGVSLQSPLDRPLILSAMLPEHAAALAAAICAGHDEIPGVIGEAQVAARFAGEWTERCKLGAQPIWGQRLYGADTVVEGRQVPGRIERAGMQRESLMREWLAAFSREISEPAPAPDFVQKRIAAGQLWTWLDGMERAMVVTTPAIAEVSRLQAVYVPGEYRRRGYAEGLVRDLTRRLIHGGIRPVLYAELANPTSNAIYRRIGYRAIAETVYYRFSAGGR